MTSELSETMSQTILVDAVSSPDVSEFRLVRSLGQSTLSDHECVGTSVAIDASTVDLSTVACDAPRLASPVASQAPQAALANTADEGDIEALRQLEHELNEASALARTKKLLTDEEELLFRRYLAREERRARRTSSVPPCVHASRLFKSVIRTFSWWFPSHPCLTSNGNGNTEGLWWHYGVRQCDCLGGPQGFHRPDCTLQTAPVLHE